MKIISFDPFGVRLFYKPTITLTLTIAFLFFSLRGLHAQQWMETIRKGNRNFYDIQKAFYKYQDSLEEVKNERRDPDEKEEEDEGELSKFKRWEWFMEPRVYPSGDITLPGRTWTGFQKYLDSKFPGQQSQRTTSTQSIGGNWTALGPFSVPTNGGGLGRVNCIRIDPNNPNNIWLASPSGGLWKSTNGGTSWTTNTDQLTVIGCSDLAFDPNNSNIIYLATGDGEGGSIASVGVLKSTNGGASWNSTGLTFSPDYYVRIHKLVAHPTNSNILFAATTTGIYKTANAGVNWTQITFGDITDIAFKPGNATIIYAAGSGNFYKSSDTGANFSTITTGLPASASVGRYSIAVTPANVNYVYLLASSSADYGYYGLYRSTNSGAGFSARSTTPNILGWSNDGSDGGGQGWYDLALTVNPSNANDVYVGGINHWRSTDGGTTWTCKAQWTECCGLPYVHADVHMLAFLDGTSTTIFSANDGGLFKSTNNGTTWSDISNGLAISQIYRLGSSVTNANLVLTGLQDNGTNKLNTTWDRIAGGDGMECLVDYSNPNILYVSYQNGVIIRSPDAGANWFTIVNNGDVGVNGGGGWITPYVLHPTNPSTMLVGKTQVYRSTNSGTDWTQVGDIAGGLITALAYAPSNPNYIYAASANYFCASTNGNTFTERTNRPALASTTGIAVSNINPAKVWMTSSGYLDGEKVYMSTDAGVTWTNFSTGLPNLPVNCIVYQNGSNDAVYVGTDVGVYYRNGAMSSWQPYFNGLPNVMIDELEIQYSSGKIRAATYGRGLWESDIVPGCTPPSKTWIGMVSNAWENPANWSCGTLPDANTDVTINSGSVILSSNATVRSFTVKAGVSFTVTPGYKLTVNH